MAGEQGSLGRVSIKVEICDSSPFIRKPQQECYYWFDRSNIQTMIDPFSFDQKKPDAPQYLYANPDGIAGFRIGQTAYTGFSSNFLKDASGNKLEEGAYSQTTSVPGSTDGGSVTSSVDGDGNAARMVELVKGQTATTPDGVQVSLDSATQSFFTWMLCNSLFKPTGSGTTLGTATTEHLPPPVFTEAPHPKKPVWTYHSYNSGEAGAPVTIMPFVEAKAPDDYTPIHWGAMKELSIARNQPFQITFRMCTRVPGPARLSTALQTRDAFKFGDKDIDLGLTNAVYFAVETGIGSQNNFLFVFKSGEAPYFFSRESSGNWGIRGRLEDFNAAQLFDDNNKELSLQFEEVGGALVITSNVFGQTPWIIKPPDINSPYMIEPAQIAVYGGNVSGGFLLVPVQYKPIADFCTPALPFALDQVSNIELSCTSKGPGQVEQDRSKGALWLMEADSFNGQTGSDLIARYSGIVEGLDREVEAEALIFGTPRGDVMSIWITLTASDVTQPGGLVLKNSRSPHIFFLRAVKPAEDSGGSISGKDISCDVMSVDLSWTAASLNEITQSGTIKLINNRPDGGTDYKAYSNRITYIKISAGWEEGVASVFSPAPIFQGMVTNISFQKNPGIDFCTLKVEDYMNVLHFSKFMLCPAYDGMKASLALRDMANYVGIPNDKVYCNGSVMSDEGYGNDEYGLPITNPFEQPMFRFPNGSAVKEGIMKIAKMDMRTIFFDEDGNFHIEPVPMFEQASAPTVGDFYSTKSGLNHCWKEVTFSRLVNDHYNSILIGTVNKKTQNRMYARDNNPDNPGQEGYVGFSKVMIINEPAYGNSKALHDYLEKMAKMIYHPPLQMKFEIIGRPGFRPLNFVTVDGQKVRITSVTSHISATENTYWMNVEGEYQYSSP